MEWAALLSHRRLGQPARDRAHRPRTPFQVDHDRIVFSSAFRRLQDKTQVFPLAESDFVRTRLTHSMEVSCVGRSLGTRAGEFICQKHRLADLHPSDFGAIVAAAALAHDVGNPPFGHSGEDAIRHWFDTSPVAAATKRHFTHAQLADFHRYEGNAHAFRVVSVLQMSDNTGGMQLTCATLGALAKYPIESDTNGESANYAGSSAKKFNFFQAEKSLFAEVADQTGLISRSENAAWWCRHPLAFLVEAADDICYYLIDFEDAYRHDLISYDEIRETFLGIIDSRDTADRLSAIADKKRQIEFLRAKAIGKLVDQAAEAFIERDDAILSGEFDWPLLAVTSSAPKLETIASRSRESIYSNGKVVAIEAAGFEVLGGLLDIFVGSANELAWNSARASSRAAKSMKLVPAQFFGASGEPDADDYLRLLRLVDFVAGMTDTYAVSLYKRLRGISL